MLHKLRIAFSVCCGMVGLLLIALWVRSYWWFDYTPGGGISSAMGSVYVGEEIVLRANSPSSAQFSITRFGTFAVSLRGLGIEAMGNGVTAPYWAVTMVVAACAALPWLRWHFSLRTLLIATTLVAVLLGAIAYAVR